MTRRVIDISNYTFNKILVVEEVECWNINGNKTDKNGRLCDEYDSGLECGKYDDEDFDSLEMCCGCGGGKKGKIFLAANFNRSGLKIN